ncbi:MAG: hypothetical protein Ta2G_07120 [Termitinemataceae bacterium]|nr:MAG: hypothetical protein Ta2G_07120 [Termitinemataceae bacterium]
MLHLFNKNVANGLRFKFVMFFLVVSILISLVIYIPYVKHLDDSWKRELGIILKILKTEYPQLVNTQYLIEQAEQKSDEFWQICSEWYTLSLSLDVAYIYYVKELPDGKYQFILSSEFIKTLDDCLEPSYDAYMLPEMEAAYKSGEITFSALTQDAEAIEFWGTLVSGVIPIKDSQGVIRGALGVDYDYSQIQSLKDRGLYTIIAAIFLSVIASLLLSHNISLTLIHPLREMKDLANDMSQMKFERKIVLKKKGEVGDMQKALWQARHNLKWSVQDLKNERDKLAAVKEHLKIGVFIMDENNIIEDYYFRELENIVAQDKLSGKNFIDIISPSLSENNLSALKDFFDMIRCGDYDEDLLEDINPIDEFVFKAHNGQEKTLRCVFTLLESTTNSEDESILKKAHILSGIEDVSNEVKLKKHIAEAEKQKQEEMRVLFEVFRIDSSVCEDIVSTAEHNFNKIKSILKEAFDNNLPAPEALTSIFQLIHAVKSDALIVGLESFGERLHNFETQIKALQENKATSSIMQSQMGELDKLVDEKNKLSKTLQILSGYRDKEIRKEIMPSDILANTIQKTCDKLSFDLNKKVVFVRQELQVDEISEDKRRSIKDILVQIVRNAIYHGIEDPEERIAALKDETGKISLSIKKIGGGLRDRGRI